jgi:hydroxymethylbilane synthase
MAAHNFSAEAFEIVPFKTVGDKILNRPLSAFGGKGMFTAEIEKALSEGSIDLAVHSTKDVATRLPDFLEMSVFPQRGDVRDALISRTTPSVTKISPRDRVGTSSIRRKAQILHYNPHIQPMLLRGNVGTRIRKFEQHQFDTIILAMVGLKRLNMENAVTAIIEPEVMLPAVGQGAIGIEIHRDNGAVSRLIHPLHHRDTGLCITTERAFLDTLNGNCQMPIAGLAIIENDLITFRAEILAPDGSMRWGAMECGDFSSGESIGRSVAERIREFIPSSIIPQ